MRGRPYIWLELSYRPKKEGLHESGYRYLKLVGAYRDENDEIQRDELHQWSDHVLTYGPTNIDVTEDGTIRIMPWAGSGWVTYDGNEWYPSSAMFYPKDNEAAIKTMQVNTKILKEVYGQ